MISYISVFLTKILTHFDKSKIFNNLKIRKVWLPKLDPVEAINLRITKIIWNARMKKKL